MRDKVRVLGLMGLLLMQRCAVACVTCNSQTACQVRHGIFDHRFLHTLLVTSAPFPVLAGCVALVYFGFPMPRGEQA